MADRRVDLQAVEQGGGVGCVGADRVVGHVAGRRAESGQVGGQDAESLGQRGSQLGEVPAAPGTTMEQEHRGFFESRGR
jgi:hypothetical protein